MSGIKEAYTTQELMIILGVRDASTVLRRAKREGWLSRSCSGRGGGFEWLVSSMPEKTRLAIAYAVKPAEDAPATVAAPALPNTAPLRHLSEKERNTVMARLAFVREIERLALVSSYRAAISSLVLASLQGTLPARLSGLVQFANARYGRGESRGLSERRLYEWRAAYAEKGEAGLIPRHPQKVMTPPAWLHLFLAFWQRPQKPSVAQAYEEFAGACQSIIAGAGSGFPVDLNVTDMQRFLLNAAAELQQSGIPSVYAVRRWLQKIALPEREAGRRTGNALLHLRPHKLRLTDDLLPTDVYTADGTTADVEVLHPYNGQPFKPELTFVMDVATRRVVGVSVALAEDKFTILDALRMACCAGGIPAIFYANDSGSLDPITVTVEVQYCLENSCEWKGLATLMLSDAKRSAVMKYEEFGVERVAEPYKLRARRASGPTGDRYISDVYWEYYHEVITDDFHLPGTALFAIWAMPTESLSGSIPKVTCSDRRDTAMLPASDGSTVARPLSNPAYAVLELALNARYGAGELAANVDLQSFELAADWCDRKEIRGGMYIDAAMTFETAAGYWGQAGRFTLERVGVRLTCLSDRPQDFQDAAFLVTSTDVQQGTFGMDWGNLEDRADGFEVTWFDDKRGKQTLFAPGPFFWKDKDRPPRVSPVTLYPCRDEDTAYRAANYLNRCNQYLTRTCSYTLGCKALGSHLHNGSVVQIAVDLLLNTQSGLVASATATTVTLNRDVHLEPGKAYEIALSHIDREDTRTGRELVEFVPLAPVDKATTTRTLTLAVPWRHVPSRDCSCAVGPLDRVVRWYRVTSMSRASDMTVKLSCLEYDEHRRSERDRHTDAGKQRPSNKMDCAYSALRRNMGGAWGSTG